MTERPDPAKVIPGPDPGACPSCGEWRKSGMIHNCGNDPVNDPAKVIAEALAEKLHWLADPERAQELAEAVLAALAAAGFPVEEPRDVDAKIASQWAGYRDATIHDDVAARPVTAPDNPPVTFAFWECGHIEVDRGRSHACPLDVCGATYAVYAPVADEDVIRADERERLSARVYENGRCLRERSERARVFADADGEAPTREQKLVEILSRLTDPDPDGGTREQKLVEILSRLTDPDPCSYDHHGACRAHNLHKRPCPHGAAKDLLRELRPEGTDA